MKNAPAQIAGAFFFGATSIGAHRRARTAIKGDWRLFPRGRFRDILGLSPQTGRKFFGKPTYVTTVWLRSTPSNFHQGDFTYTVPASHIVDDIVAVGGWVNNAVDHYKVSLPLNSEQTARDVRLIVYCDGDGIQIERGGCSFGGYDSGDIWFKIWIEFTKQ